MQALWREVVAVPLEQAGAILGHPMGKGKTLRILLYELIHRTANSPTLSHHIPEDPGPGKLLIMYLTSFIDNEAAELSKMHPAPLYVDTIIYIKAYTSTDKPRAWAAPYTPGVLILGSERLVKLVAAEGELSELIYERATILVVDKPTCSRIYHQSGSSLPNIQAWRCIAMTGTPMSNSVDEIWLMLEIFLPAFAGTCERLKDLFGVIGEGLYAGASDRALRQTKRALERFWQKKRAKSSSYRKKRGAVAVFSTTTRGNCTRICEPRLRKSRRHSSQRKSGKPLPGVVPLRFSLPLLVVGRMWTTMIRSERYLGIEKARKRILLSKP